MRRLVLALVLAALAAPAAASAHGGAAVEYLEVRNLFVPIDGNVPAASTRELSALLDEAKAKGYPVRVAVVTDGEDLEPAPSLYGRPDLAATFLARQLAGTFRGPLLVVMAGGYGFDWRGHAPAEARRALAELPKPSESPDLAQAGAAAVRALAAQKGVRLAAPHVAQENETRDRAIIAVAALVLAAVVGAALWYRRRRQA